MEHVIYNITKLIRMSIFITRFYRYIVPSSTRDSIYNYFLKDVLTVLRTISFHCKSKTCYILSLIIPYKGEKFQAWGFLGKNGKTQYPGVDTLKYEKMHVEVHHDLSNNLPYVIHCNKRLYFPRTFEDNYVVKVYKSLIIEQDICSAHKYVESNDIFKDKTLLDIGAAEGIIALEAIELAKYVYLFESDKEWIEALTATFSPWKNKVEIIKKYISDKDDEDSGFISLDTFFKNKPIDDLFIKMDIEGAELDALKGALHILKNGKKLDFSICTYHYDDDSEKISAFLKTYGHTYNFTKGYLYITWWLRKGIIRSC